MRPAINKRGFTLIEVLVTLVILMFGLLGIAGLMAKGQRASYEAYQRQAALAIANDMAERMRANRAQSALYVTGTGTPVGENELYKALLDGGTTDCGTLIAPAGCSGDQLVAYDLAQWDGLLVGYGERTGGANVGGIVGAVGCIEDLTPGPGAACPLPAGTGTTISHNYRVSVAWQGNEDTFAPDTTQCGSGRYGTETKRRVVALDLLLICP